ncbi:hypothetical protein MMC25_007543 [Agyrium rufum]|nr:hypothetical protein [Agyrium rufum]
MNMGEVKEPAKIPTKIHIRKWTYDGGGGDAARPRFVRGSPDDALGLPDDVLLSRAVVMNCTDGRLPSRTGSANAGLVGGGLLLVCKSLTVMMGGGGGEEGGTVEVVDSVARVESGEGEDGIGWPHEGLSFASFRGV